MNVEESPRDRIAGALRSRVESGALHPGDKLPAQDRLAAEFGVHRSVVRQALDLLEIEGLVARPGKQGARAHVLGAQESGYASRRPRRTAIELSERIEEAFRAEHVSIDSVSLTTETLNQALAQTLVGIGPSSNAPQSVTARLLLPSPEASLAYPRHLTDPEDKRPLSRQNELMRTYAFTLKNTLESLTTRDVVPQVSVDIRTMPITPTFKLYLLNKTEALFGYYRVVERSVRYRKTGLDIYDVLGMDAKLFRHSRLSGHEVHEAAFAEESLQWFESMWESISEPLDLS